MFLRLSKERYRWFGLLIAAGLLLTNCGKDAGEEAESAILQAEIFLSTGKCQEAIDVLEAVGRSTNNTNHRYVITLASGYACRAGFSTTRFFGSDLAFAGSPSALGGFVRFSTSSLMTEPRDENYEDLLEAINILLYAGGIDLDRNPTIARRALTFQAEDQKEIRAFLTYLLMAHVGQYLFHYGNGSTTGIKGTRVGGGNTCLADYSNLPIANTVPTLGNATTNAYLDDNANFPNGTCSSAGSGSTDLGTAGTLDISRMCQLVVGLNNLFEVLPVFLNETTGNTNFGSLGPVDTAITAGITLLTTAQPSTTTLTQTQSQTLCEQNNATDTELQYFFALFVEPLFL